MSVMASGDNPVDPTRRDARYAFCDKLKEAGDHIFKDDSDLIRRTDP
jgi:hypothetical protein